VGFQETKVAEGGPHGEKVTPFEKGGGSSLKGVGGDTGTQRGEGILPIRERASSPVVLRVKRELHLQSLRRRGKFQR